MLFIFYFRTTPIAVPMRMFLDVNLNTLHYFLPLFQVFLAQICKNCPPEAVLIFPPWGKGQENAVIIPGASVNGTTEAIPFKLHLAIDFLGFCKRPLANIVWIANGKTLEFIKIYFHLYLGLWRGGKTLRYLCCAWS